MVKCTFCGSEIRETKKNVELKAHWESRHATSTFAICFPTTFDPTVAVVGGDSATTTTTTTAAPTKVADAPKKKKTEDFSFLDSALNSKNFKKK